MGGEGITLVVSSQPLNRLSAKEWCATLAGLAVAHAATLKDRVSLGERWLDGRGERTPLQVHHQRPVVLHTKIPAGVGGRGRQCLGTGRGRRGTQGALKGVHAHLEELHGRERIFHCVVSPIAAATGVLEPGGCKMVEAEVSPTVFLWVPDLRYGVQGKVNSQLWCDGPGCFFEARGADAPGKERRDR